LRVYRTKERERVCFVRRVKSVKGRREREKKDKVFNPYLGAMYKRQMKNK
jgi:hypothetical protein